MIVGVWGVRSRARVGHGEERAYARVHQLFTTLVITSLSMAHAQSTVCAANFYANGNSCSPCGSGSFSLAGATSSAQCHPFALSGPTDTIYSFYGTTDEILSTDYTIIGTPTALTSAIDAFGNAAAALSTTGAANLVSTVIRSELPVGQAARTTSVWVKTTNCGNVVVYLWGELQDGRVWGQLIANGGKMYLWNHNLDVNVNSNLCDDKWHNLVWTMEGNGIGTIKSYIDGVLTPSEVMYPNTSLDTQPSRFKIGAGAHSYGAFSGIIFDIRVYSRALSPTEVLAISQPPIYVYPNVVPLNPTIPTAGATSYTFGCATGYFGTSSTLRKSSIDNSWTWDSGGSSPTCNVICPTHSYSYGGLPCSTCYSGSTFVSSSLGCRPSSSSSSNPIDTSFYLSGSHLEGVSAFPVIVNTSGGISHFTSSTSYPSAALTLSRGSYVSSPLLSSLPTGSSSFTVSSWVKCNATLFTDASPSSVVVSWGASDVSNSASLAAATLAVTSQERLSSPIVTVSTLAGSGAAGSTDGTGTNTMFHRPWGISIDFSGNMYVADHANHRIRKVTPSGVVTTLAGSGSAGSTDGTGTNAMFNNPLGVAVDSSGNVYVGDHNSHRIRKSTPLGAVTTFAGSNTASYADGTGTNAMFFHLTGVAVDTSGNVFVGDFSDHRIRKVTPSGVVTTLAGSGSAGSTDGTGTNAMFNIPLGVAVDSLGNVFVADRANHRIRKITSSGVVTTLAGRNEGGFADGTGTNAMFNAPYDVCVDLFGTVYVTDSYNHRIRKVTSSGLVTTISGSGSAGYSDGIGTNAVFNHPGGVAIDFFGNLYVTDIDNNRIRKITITPSLPGPLPVCDSTWHHIALTYSGSSSTNTLSAYVDGSLVASSTTSTFAISSSSASTLRLGWNGMTPAGSSGELFSGSMSDVRIYNRSLSHVEISTLSLPRPVPFSNLLIPCPLLKNKWCCSAGSYGPSVSVSLSSIDGTWSSSNGSVNCQSCAANTYSYLGASSCSTCPSGSTLVSSSLGCRPSSSASSSPIDTSFYLSGSHLEGVSAFPVIVNTSGGISHFTSSSSYPSAALTLSRGSYVSSPLLSSLPIGSSAFTVSSWVKCNASSLTDASPSSVVVSWGASEVSTSASLAAATLGVTSQDRLSSPIVTVSTFAGSGTAGFADGTGTNAQFNLGDGIAVDETGTVFVCDRLNQRIRKISATGFVTTLAGSGTAGYADGAGTNAQFNNPYGVVVDSTGHAYITDSTNNRIRKISATGIVSTFAGSGIAGYADGTGTNAMFNRPGGVAVDKSGTVYVSDVDNQRIRKISETGVVTTLAGGGTAAGSSDGTGTNAKFWNPYHMVVDPSGNVLIADSSSNVIRKVTPSGVVTTVPGSLSYSAYGVGVDKFENIYIADTFNSRIMKVTPSGVTTNLAGVGTLGFADGAGTDAMFRNPHSVAVDHVGNVYVSDTGNHRIRKITITPSLPGPLPVCDSTWHHIALTYSGSSSTNTLSAYVDGSLIASSTTSTFAISSSSTSSLRLGWNGMTPSSSTGELFSGSISDIRIYNRTLSLSEINLLKIPPPSPSPTPSSSPTPTPTLTPTSSPTLTASRTPSPSASLTPSSTSSQITKVLTAAGGVNDSSSSSLSLTSIVLILVGSNILLGVSVLAFVLLKLYRNRSIVVPLGDETRPKTLQEQLVRLREKKLLQVEVDQNSIADSTEAFVVKTETIHPHSNEELEKTMEFAGEVRLYQQLSKLRNKLDSNKKKKIKTLAPAN